MDLKSSGPEPVEGGSWFESWPLPLLEWPLILVRLQTFYSKSRPRKDTLEGLMLNPPTQIVDEYPASKLLGTYIVMSRDRI
ncbi:unnamed protein product, partial [Nesidiocoris tenuis]